MKARHLINKGQAARQVTPIRPATLGTRTITPAVTINRPKDAAPASPKLPACGGVDVWITASQACKMLGVGLSAIYRLIDPEQPFLVCKRPLPRKILISLRSVTAFSEATKNPEFWQSAALQEQLGAKLRQIAENKA